jgi:hypothetical protein
MGFFRFSKRPKYGNKKVDYNGITFDSKKERDRYIVLVDAQNRGEISHLETQVKYILIPAIREEYEVELKTKTVVKTRTLQKAITYTADFRYFHNERQEWVVSDVKASALAASLDKCFVLKEKMMFALNGIKVKRVYKANDEI